MFFVLFYMSSKFIVIVDILGCNFIVTDLILHIYSCTTALGKSMFCFTKMFPGVGFFHGQKRIAATFFFFVSVDSTMCISVSLH